MLLNLKHIKDTDSTIKSSSHYEIDMEEFKVGESVFSMKNKIVATLVHKIGRDKFDKLLQESVESIRKITCRHLSCSNKCQMKYTRKKLTVSNYCSKECFMDRPERHNRIQAAHQCFCRYCNSSFQHTSPINPKSKKDTNVCYSPDCRKKSSELRGKAIKDTHWTKRDDAAEISKRKSESRICSEKKRREKWGPRIPWNKGKTGIYSKETIEKIRDAALKQIEKAVYRKTNIEKAIEQLLIGLNINYKYSFILQKRQYDFLLIDYNIIIECDGDYWHANPKSYGDETGKKKLTQRQRMKRKDDLVKNKIAEYNNYIILRFWGWDINHHLEDVKVKILEEIQKK